MHYADAESVGLEIGFGEHDSIQANVVARHPPGHSGPIACISQLRCRNF